MSFFYEQPLAPVHGSFADGVADFSELAKAARDAAWYADNMAASDAAIEDAYDRRNDEIFKATGQRLGNPYRQHLAAVRGRSLPDGKDFGAEWQETAAKLQDNHPDMAQSIRAHVPIREDAKALAQEAGLRFDEALASRPDFAGKWTALLGGGFAGSLRDPLQLGTLMLGGGAGNARNTAVRVLEVAGKEAVVSGSVEALMQPMVQAWREQAGLSHGFDEAMRNTLVAAGFGAVFGGAVEAVGTAARATLRSLSPEVRGAWNAVEAEAYLAQGVPPGMSREQFDAEIAEALRVAEHEKDFAGVPLHQVNTQGSLKRPTNVVEFIASLGGLRDDDGELAARGLTIRSSMTRNGPFMRKKGELVEGGGLFGDATTTTRGKGLSADEIREKLVEAGYLDDAEALGGGEARTTASDIYELIDQHLAGKTVVARGDEGWQVEVDAKKRKRSVDFELGRYGDDAWIAEAHGAVIADEAIVLRTEGVAWTRDDLEWAAEWHSRNPQETARVAIDEAIIQRMMKQNDEADALSGGKVLDVALATLPVDVDANGKVITYGNFIQELEGNRSRVQGQGRSGDGPGRQGPADRQLENSGSPRQAAGEGSGEPSLNESPPPAEGGLDDPLDGSIDQWVDDIVASEKLLRKPDADAEALPATDLSESLVSPFEDLPGEHSLADLIAHAERPKHLAQLVEACKAV
jgi:hypothetical protein